MNQEQFWKSATELLEREKQLVMMVVTASEGSSPGRAGFWMAVGQSEILGSIGGGTMEYRFIQQARDGLYSHRIFQQEVVHELESASSSGMICSGSQTLAVIWVEDSSMPLLERICAAYEKNEIHKICLSEAGLELDASRENMWYSEVIGCADTLYIIGGGHVSLAISAIMPSLGFKVIVYDNRPVVSTMEANLFADEKQVIDYQDVADYIPEGKHVFVAIMTFGHFQDMQVLQALLHKKVAYLGMMASRAKKAEVFAALRKEGCSAQLLEAVHCPIGLTIKSHTPAEIAISIAAEIISVKNGGEITHS